MEQNTYSRGGYSGRGRSNHRGGSRGSYAGNGGGRANSQQDHSSGYGGAGRGCGGGYDGQGGYYPRGGGRGNSYQYNQQYGGRGGDRQISSEPNVSIPTGPVPYQGNPYVPIKRHDRGTLASRGVKLLVNHFPVKFSPSTSILRYDVDVKKAINPEASSAAAKSAKKSIPKSDLRLIQEKLWFPLLQTAYEGEKNIYSAVELPSGTYNVELFGRSYTCTIKYLLAENSAQLPRDVLQAVDVVMKANLFREKVSVGRGMYPREYRKEDDLLNCGVAPYRGSQQSIKITSKGLVLCSDYSAIPFRKRMSVIEYLMEHIYEIKQASDIARYQSSVMYALKGLRVSVTHRFTKQKYMVAGLTVQLTKDISFEWKDPTGKNPPKTVMLTDYFRQNWDKEIVHTDIPCLMLGNSNKPNYVPMEYCVLADDRRYLGVLGTDAARKLKDLSLLPPENRRTEISDMVHQEYATGRNG
ncbi:argonaute 2-like protein, partial [Tanacetum coccineum]